MTGKECYRMPDSFSAFCKIVSLTVTKTRRIFDVSVACVILVKASSQQVRVQAYITYCGYTLKRARFVCIKRHKMYFAPLLTSEPPVYSGKKRSNGT